MSISTLDDTREALLAAADELAAAAALGTDDRVEPSDDWSLAPESMRFVTALVRHLAPRHVLEFGSGVSTVELGRACAALEAPATLVAIENDPVHVRSTRDAVAGEGLDANVRVVPAALVARRCHERFVPVYLYDAAASGAACAVPDLVLVDGPPLPLGGREGSLYQALHAARAGTVVVLDDSRRDSERDLLVRMLRTFDGHLEAMDMLGFPKGLAAILVTEHLDADDFPEGLIHGA